LSEIATGDAQKRAFYRQLSPELLGKFESFYLTRGWWKEWLNLRLQRRGF
jgi:hypothetical protein